MILDWGRSLKRLTNKEKIERNEKPTDYVVFVGGDVRLVCGTAEAE